jgi:hypothetical protein
MHSTAFDGERAMRTRARKLGVVCGDDDRAAFPGELTKRRGQIAASGGIERCRRFVHQKDVRLDRQGAGDRHALRLTARQFVWHRERAITDTE